MKSLCYLAILIGGSVKAEELPAFAGTVTCALIEGADTNELLYTVGSDHLRIENLATNWPHPVNIVDMKSGDVTLIFPHNRSFVRLGSRATGGGESLPLPFANPAQITHHGTGSPSARAMPTMPPGLSPLPRATATPTGIGPQPGGVPSGIAGLSAMPAMPIASMMSEKMELKATGQITNILGLACERHELKQRGETLEVWAARKQFPFQPYLRHQPARFGPRTIQEQWPELLKARKLFPLLVSLQYDNGTERFRFEVKSLKPEKITDSDGTLFQPPPGYHQIEPLPF